MVESIYPHLFRQRQQDLSLWLKTKYFGELLYVSFREIDKG